MSLFPEKNNIYLVNKAYGVPPNGVDTNSEDLNKAKERGRFNCLPMTIRVGPQSSHDLRLKNLKSIISIMGSLVLMPSNYATGILGSIVLASTGSKILTLVSQRMEKIGSLSQTNLIHK